LKLKHVEKLIGKGKLQKPSACQIALRFPEDAPSIGSDVHTLSGREWHVDGMRQGKRNPFSLLLGVALSKCPNEYNGNFTIFPKSHNTIHSLILENGRLKGIDEHRLWSVATDPNNPWCQQQQQEDDNKRKNDEEKIQSVAPSSSSSNNFQPKLPD
jgi:hypothetical protein